MEGVGGLKYFSCSMINETWLNFNGRVDTGGKCLTLCCEPIQSRPASAFKDTARETVEGFINMRKGVIVEGKKHANSSVRGKRLYTAGCAKCANYQPGEWDGDSLISAAGYLLALLWKNELSADMFNYAPSERQLVAAFAHKLLQSGEI